MIISNESHCYFYIMLGYTFDVVGSFNDAGKTDKISPILFFSVSDRSQ